MVSEWYTNGMKTTIDRAGRVVIPKVLRERAGLTPGMEIEVRFQDGNIEIVPPPPQGRLVRIDGMLLWDPGPDAPPFDVQEAIERVRQEREDEIMGRNRE
jgi:AbrB family looped-hinge helix DNA binding protein